MLRYLLNFWFPVFGLFFAASAAVVSGGDGGADAGGSGSDPGDGGGAGDSGDAGTGDGDGSADHHADAADGGADAGAGDQNALVDDGAGRKIPQKYAELFKNDKDLKARWFAADAIAKKYPGGVKEALALPARLEEITGVEGGGVEAALDSIEQMQSDLSVHTKDAELFANSPDKWIEMAFTENSDASLKAFSHSLDYVSDKFPEHYDHLMAKVIVNTLTGDGSPIPAIQNALLAMKSADGKANPEAQQLAAALYKWYKGLDETARKVPEKKVDASQNKRESELTQREQAARNKEINVEAVPYLNRTIAGSLDKAAKDSGFDLGKIRTEQPQRYERFLKDVRAAIHESVRGDTKWLDRYAAALASGDTKKCVRMLNARHDQAIHGTGRDAGVVTPIFHEWFGAGKAKKKTNDAGGNQDGDRGGVARPGAGNTTPLRVSAMPPKNEIDWHHDKTRIIDQVAMRKDGKLVTWAS